MTKRAKIISNIVYGIGAAIALVLVFIAVLGGNEPINPEAMFPVTPKERAFIGLAVGAIPMIFAGMAVCKFNDVKNFKHKVRSFILIFLPGAVCAGCMLFLITVIVIGYLNMFLNWGPL